MTQLKFIGAVQSEACLNRNDEGIILPVRVTDVFFLYHELSDEDAMTRMRQQIERIEYIEISPTFPMVLRAGQRIMVEGKLPKASEGELRNPYSPNIVHLLNEHSQGISATVYLNYQPRPAIFPSPFPDN